MIDIIKEISEMIDYSMNEWDENLLTYANLKDIVEYVYKKGFESWYASWLYSK